MKLLRRIGAAFLSDCSSDGNSIVECQNTTQAFLIIRKYSTLGAVILMARQRRLLTTVGLAATLLLVASDASAQTLWTDGVGDWFSAGNWSLGVPNPASGTAFDARIDNGGIAKILVPGASVRRITLGA